MLRFSSKVIARSLVIVLCTLAAFSNDFAQKVKKAPVKPVEQPKSIQRPRKRPQPRPTVISTTPASTESSNFFDLGERFRKERKWNAAEAAYKEAVKVWRGNAQAWLELGYLYVDRNKIPEAQGVYRDLRAVDSAFAAELLADINFHKANSR
jgi:tetratricopeptide (TPR) repeat protein